MPKVRFEDYLDDEDQEIHHPPKKAKTGVAKAKRWCHNCDAALDGDQAKCHLCGADNRPDRKRR